MGINRIALRAAAALAIALPATAQTIDAAEKKAVVAKAGEMLLQRYVFPARAAQAKAKMDAELAAGGYDRITYPAIFAGRLTATLQSVPHDKHMRVMLSDRPPPSAINA